MKNKFQKVFVLVLMLIAITVNAQNLSYTHGQYVIKGISGPYSAGEKGYYLKISDKATVEKFSKDGKFSAETRLQRIGLISPDGKLSAFVENNKLTITDVVSGESRVIANVPQTDHFLGNRIQKNFSWSSDSKQIVYVAAESEVVEPETDVKVYDRIMYKTHTGFTDNRKTHLYVVSVDGGKSRPLTQGNYDEQSVSWQPGGSNVVFISNRSDDPDDNHNNDVWTVDVESGEVVQITNTPGTEINPQWSLDGKRIAYLAGFRPINTKDSQAENAHIMIVSVDGGEPVDLSIKLDRRVRSYQWGEKHIYFTVSNHGSQHLYRTDISGENLEILVDDIGRVTSYAINEKEGAVYYQFSNASMPGEIFRLDLKNLKKKQISNFQADFVEKVSIVVPETVWFLSHDGVKVQGWLMKPAHFDANRKYPLIMTIHGGPHGGFSESISETNQVFAEQGFGVLYINPRGSSGYGQKFVDGTINNWGGGDYQDLMSGLDYVIKQNSWIDTERLGVTGGSYGGYMTNWVITQTDRFKAAVSSASVSNLVSFYGTSLYQLLVETEFPGEVWDNWDLLWHWSPLKHVKNVSTPTLFLHGESDHDVPITQAEEMFIALKKLGVESTLVRYPNEGHGISQPAHRADYNKRRLNWFIRLLKPELNTRQ